MNNIEEYREKCTSKYQKDALDYLQQVDKNLDKIKSLNEKIADEILDTQSFEQTNKVIKLHKSNILFLKEITDNAPYKEETEFYTGGNLVDLPIRLEKEDGFDVVYFDFDIPVIRNPFDYDDKCTLRKNIQSLPKLDKKEHLLLCYEFHLGTSNSSRDKREIENRDMRLITDMLVSYFSYFGDGREHFSEFRYNVLDGKYYTKAYLLEPKDIQKFSQIYLEKAFVKL